MWCKMMKSLQKRSDFQILEIRRPIVQCGSVGSSDWPVLNCAQNNNGIEDIKTVLKTSNLKLSKSIHILEIYLLLWLLRVTDQSLLRVEKNQLRGHLQNIEKYI